MEVDVAAAVTCFEGALGKTAEALNVPEPNRATWWPQGQTDATVLSWAIALEWMERLHGACPLHFYSAWGTGREKKQKLLRKYQVGSSERRRHFAYEYLVDISAGPRAGNEYLLAMESEVAVGHGVGAEIAGANGYVWDFAKLLYLRSQLRVFVSRVGPGPRGRREKRPADERSRERRAELWRSLEEVCRSVHHEGPLVVYVLAGTKRRRFDSACAIWQPNVGLSRTALVTADDAM